MCAPLVRFCLLLLPPLYHRYRLPTYRALPTFGLPHLPYGSTPACTLRQFYRGSHFRYGLLPPPDITALDGSYACATARCTQLTTGLRILPLSSAITAVQLIPFATTLYRTHTFVPRLPPYIPLFGCVAGTTWFHTALYALQHLSRFLTPMTPRFYTGSRFTYHAWLLPVTHRAPSYAFVIPWLGLYRRYLPLPPPAHLHLTLHRRAHRLVHALRTPLLYTRWIAATTTHRIPVAHTAIHRVTACPLLLPLPATLYARTRTRTDLPLRFTVPRCYLPRFNNYLLLWVCTGSRTVPACYNHYRPLCLPHPSSPLLPCLRCLPVTYHMPYHVLTCRWICRTSSGYTFAHTPYPPICHTVVVAPHIRYLRFGITSSTRNTVLLAGSASSIPHTHLPFGSPPTRAHSLLLPYICCCLPATTTRGRLRAYSTHYLPPYYRHTHHTYASSLTAVHACGLPFCPVVTTAPRGCYGL